MTTTEDADTKDFSTFMRFFCTRMVQTVVQARMGKMQPTPCSPNPEQSNWFNIALDEIGEVAAYLKSTIGKNYPPKINTLSLEFILYTADGDQLPLETWVVRIDKECQDWSVNIRTTLYQQMSTLLKSIIMAARFTPTYRHYVRNQGPETFVIIYRVFEGEPDLSLLGDEVKYKRLGYLPSPFGTLSVDLHYRTKMVIQPQPYVEEGSREELVGLRTKAQEIPLGLGVAIPAEGSQVIAVSPSSADNINLFSTSPISQDLPFRAKSPNFTIGRSFSSADAMDQNRPHQLSGGSNSDQPSASSPPTSSSFPQRTSMQKIRTRNNSFPFASLLLCSQTSSEQLVKTLPNVPEDAALNTPSTDNPMNDAEARNSTGNELRCNSSIGIEIVGYSDESTNRLKSSSQNLDQQSHPSSSKILFRCSSDNRENEGDEMADSEKQPVPVTSLKEGKEANDGAKEKEQWPTETEDINNDVDSDDSYVKVMAFASGTFDENLGTDLSEFFREVRLAPENLRSFSTETAAADLGKQLDEFRQKETLFRGIGWLNLKRGEGNDEEEEEE